MKGDDKVLSYGDVLLRRSDVELLEGPRYLNDQIIEFFFSYLTANLTGNGNSSRLLLVGPAITYWLLHCPDSQSLNDASTPLQLHNREVLASLAFPLFLIGTMSIRFCWSRFRHAVHEAFVLWPVTWKVVSPWGLVATISCILYMDMPSLCNIVLGSCLSSSSHKTLSSHCIEIGHPVWDCQPVRNWSLESTTA